MEGKNSDKNQALINKIKLIRSLSPSNKDIYLRMNNPDETHEKINYRNSEVQLKKASLSSLKDNQKPNATEKPNKKENKEKNRVLANSLSKTKKKSPFIDKYRKKYFPNTYFADNYKNNDDFTDIAQKSKNKCSGY